MLSLDLSSFVLGLSEALALSCEVQIIPSFRCLAQFDSHLTLHLWLDQGGRHLWGKAGSVSGLKCLWLRICVLFLFSFLSTPFQGQVISRWTHGARVCRSGLLPSIPWITTSLWKCDLRIWPHECPHIRGCSFYAQKPIRCTCSGHRAVLVLAKFKSPKSCGLSLAVT